MEPWHIVITVALACFTVVAGLNAWILNVLNGRLLVIETKLDNKVSKKSCEDVRKDCNRYRDLKEEDVEQVAKIVEKDFLRHSHTGLPNDSKVVLF